MFEVQQFFNGEFMATISTHRLERVAVEACGRRLRTHSTGGWGYAVVSDDADERSVYDSKGTVVEVSR